MSRTDPTDLIYDAALGEEAWETALNALSDALGGAAVFVAMGDPARPGSFVSRSVRYTLDWLHPAGFAEADQFDPSVNSSVRILLRGPEGRSLDRRSFCPDRAFERDPFYRAAMLGQGLYHSRVAKALDRPGQLGGGFVSRPQRAGPFDADAQALYDRWLAHLGRALRVAGALHPAEADLRTLSGVIDRLGQAVAVLDTDLTVIHSNARAQRVFAAGDGIQLSFGRLSLTPPRVARALERLIARALAPPVPGRPEPDTMRVVRPSGLPPYDVSVLPSTGAGAPLGLIRGRAVVVISEWPGETRLPGEAELARRLELSPAEARVARLTPLNLSKRQIADLLGLSENTVRSHLKTAREKTGTASVFDLALLILRMPR